jgi:hypothetical protein
MGLAYAQSLADGVNRVFTVPFNYLSQAHVSVTVDGVQVPFTWLTTSVVQLNTVPAAGTIVERTRSTPITAVLADFADSSTLTEGDLDIATLQELYINQESRDIAEKGLTALDAKALKLTTDGTYDALNHRIKNVADPVAPQDVATKNWVTTVTAGLGSGGGGSVGPTLLTLPARNSIASTSINGLVDAFQTLGYAAPFDGGGMLWKRVGSQPTHPGKAQSQDGAWWEMAAPRIDIRACGGIANGASGTSKQAYLDWMDIGVATKIPLYIPVGKFDIGDGYKSVTGACVIRGEGKRSVLFRSVRSGSADYGILMWFITTEAPVLEKFQIEYGAATFPTHPAGSIVPDADAGANYGMILTNCDGAIINELSFYGEFYVAFALQDTRNTKITHPSMAKYINRGLYIGGACVNTQIIQPNIDGSDRLNAPRADYGINTNTGAGSFCSQLVISQPVINGCTGHAIGISANSWYCQVIGGTIQNCNVGALIQRANDLSPQRCRIIDLEVTGCLVPAMLLDTYYCDIEGLRVVGSTTYQGNFPQCVVQLTGAQYANVLRNRADGMTIKGIACNASAFQACFGNTIGENDILMSGGGTGISTDATSQSHYVRGNRVRNGAPGFDLQGIGHQTSGNLTL